MTDFIRNANTTRYCKKIYNMIPTKTRENRRMKTVKLPKNLERVYRENNCQECTVVVTRMNFAKILGKFTKVKIQYESNETPKSKKGYSQNSANNRLKSNENGRVRNTTNSHPAQKIGSKKLKDETSDSPILNNILRENNRVKKPYSKKTNNDDNDNIRNEYRLTPSKIKHYGIVFENPSVINNEVTSTISLEDLIPFISVSILPSQNWSIEYFPKNGEPKDDKVYDRIAAELEDLMCAEKIAIIDKDGKSDDFPSIMDILNDNPKDNKHKNGQNNSLNLESNDVEAMLLGKADQSKSMPMDLDNTDVNSFLTDVPPITTLQTTDNNQNETNKTQETNIMDESPESPSILEVNIPAPIQTDNIIPKETMNNKETSSNNEKKPVSRTDVTQVVFKKNVNSTCQKSVICPKNLKYSICMLGKSVELLGAPKVVSSLEDLQVLLQIVDESNLDSLYVLH